MKYQQLAKQCRAQVDAIENTLRNLKALSQAEITHLKVQIKESESQRQTEREFFFTNLKKVESYLERIANMIAPSDQNYGFNMKIVGDLATLCKSLN